MRHRFFAAVGAIAFVSFAAAVTGSATCSADNVVAPIATQTAQRAAVAIKLAMGPTSAPQKPGGTGEMPADTPPHKATKHKQKRS
jgi:hypothetical protein